MQVLSRSLASLAVVAALFVAPVVRAQSIDAEKQKLIDRVLAASHPESQVLLMIQHPAADVMEKTGIALQTSRVPKEKADRAMKDAVSLKLRAAATAN